MNLFCRTAAYLNHRLVCPLVVLQCTFLFLQNKTCSHSFIIQLRDLLMGFCAWISEGDTLECSAEKLLRKKID